VRGGEDGFLFFLFFFLIRGGVWVVFSKWRWRTAVSRLCEGEIETGGLIMYRLIVEMGWLRCMRSGALLFNMCFCIAKRALGIDSPEGNGKQMGY
jgi:hypothetical protein